MKTIRSVDLAWIYATKETARMRSVLRNECANKLKELIAGNRAHREAMVLDQQGALVCASYRTTNYWQGDEDKWLGAFNKGEGIIYIAEPNYDKSSRAFLADISVPVLDGEETIGVITVGLNLDELKKEYGQLR